MQLRKSLITISGEKGFTLIELLLVVAIMSVLAAIGVGEFIDNRKQAYDRQTVAKAREWMTFATVAVANVELTSLVDDAGGTGTPAPHFPNLEMKGSAHWRIINAGGSDVWQFYLANEAGKTAYYFWIPGPACAATVDPAGLPSDQIFDDPAWRAMVTL